MKVLLLALLVALSGCGLGETASTTATLAEAKATEARELKETQARLEQSLEKAQAVADEQRTAIDNAD